ncbi:MAG: type III-B CRISPR module RAMP protein Cmr6 [Bacteroidota bacterium]
MNLKHQFYREYYADFDPRQNAEEKSSKYDEYKVKNGAIFKDRNEKYLYGYRPESNKITHFIDTKLYRPEKAQLASIPGYTSFPLTTTYPGLIFGTGYSHETSTKDEITIGFYFDHTSGLPVLPGSSVKGILRSAFPRRGLDESPIETQNGKAAFIRKFLENEGVPGKWTDEAIDALELDIFTSRRDIFLDSYPESTNDSGQLLGPDFITPHGKNPLADPIPLRMIKVLPNVVWRFEFILRKTQLSNGFEVSVKAKKNLFEMILLYLGSGAKTNLGYGKFKSSNSSTLDKILHEVSDEELKVALNLGGRWVPKIEDVHQGQKEELIKSDRLVDYAQPADTYVVRVKSKKKRKGVVFLEAKGLKINDCFDSKILGDALEPYTSGSILQVTCTISNKRVSADFRIIQKIK